MKHPLTLVGVAALLALGGGAIAQQTAPTTDTGSATGAPAPDSGMAAPNNGMAKPDSGTASPGSDSGATGSATPTDAGTPAATAQDSGGQPAPGAAQPAPAGDQSAAASTGGVSAAVQQDWAKYDPQNTGALTPLAFGTWLMASRGQDMTAQVKKSQTGKQRNLAAVKVLNATAGDFAKADTDHDRKVTPGELSAYMSM